jgi:hypothetical protein
LSIRFRAEVDVWIEMDLTAYAGTVTATTSLLNELAKQQISREIKMALDAYGLISNVASVAKTTK